MTKTTIIKSIKEASSLNLRSPWIKQKNAIKDSTFQAINQNHGIIMQLTTKNTDPCSCNKDIEYLKSEIEYLKEIIKNKERIIILLEKERGN